ncbi:TonB-dependent receptor [Chitinophagaceae bacterium MMS25-I14]
MEHPYLKSSFKTLFIAPLLLWGTAGWAQSEISGKVIDYSGKPVKGASVSLDGTIDGGTSDSSGAFHFTTDEKGNQTIVATEASHESAGMPITVNGNVGGLLIKMKKTQKLDEVVISAGSFEASGDKNKTVLTTMDIITTAGANADVVKAIQTLPGTQQQGTQTGLFVRGGDASEASIIIDEMVVQNAFFSSAPGVATRSRFSPFQFKGVSFSSGGYSARYGQALSSVLELNTLDLPEKSTVNLGLNMAGVYASGSKLWKNSGGDVSLSYNNLAPFYGLANTNVTYDKVPEGGTAAARYAWKSNKDGIVKFMFNSTIFNSATTVDDPDSAGQHLRFGIKSQTYYGGISYHQMFKNKWSLFTAASVSYNRDDINYNTDYSEGYTFKNTDNREQFRIEGKRFFSTRFNVLAGVELQHYSFAKQIDSAGFGFKPEFTETNIAGYAEAEWSPIYWLAIRPGVRYEHSDLLKESAIAPRLSMGFRTGTYGQISLAGGIFYQNPDNMYLLYGYRPKFQEAVHYIANYQWIKKDRTFRIEGYYKDYQQLVLEHSATGSYDANQYRNFISGPVDNSGHGYAKGLELFWRDRKSIKNFDYWISYSYIDTRRLYSNFLAEATPTFISDHNLSLVSKYYIEKITTQINMTYSYASGRPYYNASNPTFLGDRTPDYHNLAFTVNYLTHVKKWFTVVYAGVDNVTNQHNVFGYRYSTDGTKRYEIKPALYRNFFVGVNFSLTEFNKDEL